MNLNDLKMRPKLIGLFVITGLIPLVAIGLWSSKLVGDALTKSSYGQLEAVREIKKAQIQKMFTEYENDMAVMAETVNAFKQQAYNRLQMIQSVKIKAIETFFLDMTDELTDIKNKPFIIKALSNYNALTQTNHATWKHTVGQCNTDELKALSIKNNWQDIWIISSNGTIVYAVNNENISGSQLSTIQPEYADTCKDLGSDKSQNTAVIDIVPKKFDQNETITTFIARKMDKHKNVQGYVLISIAAKEINAIVQSSQLSDNKVTSVILGQWNRVISYRTAPWANNTNDEIDRQILNAAKLAIYDHSGVRVISDSDGNLQMLAFDPIHVDGLKWVMLGSMSLEAGITPRLEDSKYDYYTNYIQRHGYYNLFLIHSTGKVFYSVTREADYGTNMVNGKFKNSGLGKLVRHVLEHKQFAITDFEPYAPSNNKPSAFIAQPIINKSKQVEFIVALELSLEAINSIMGQREGMGNTGETYLVGSDRLMRSDSIMDHVNRSVHASFHNPDKGKVETIAVKNALAGISGTEVINNYHNQTVLSAYTPMLVGDTTWVLVAEIGENEVKNPVKALINSIIKVGFLNLVLVAVFAFFVAKGIAEPLIKGVTFARSVASGDVTAKIDIDQNDEIGLLADALRNMRRSINDVLKETNGLIQAIQNGKLTTRGNADKFSGGWRDLIDGVNNLIVTLVGHIDNIPVPSVIIDTDFNILYASQSAADMAGLPRKHIIDEKCYKIFKLDDCQTVNCVCKRAMKSCQAEHGECEAFTGGKNISVSYNGVVMKNNEDVAVGALEVIVDQTAIKHAINSAGETAAVLIDAVQDLTVSSKEISATSNQQAASVKEIVSTMEDSDQLAKSISEKITAVTEMTNETKGVVNDGFAVIQSSMKQMDEIKASNAATIREIKVLGDKVESIWEIVNMINVIADQTKIIAFNAELEASSAGQSGHNFQIVASEIRRLADSTVSSTHEIKSKINEIQATSNHLIAKSEEGTEKIIEGWEMSNKLQEQFGVILKSADISVGASDRIALSIKQQVSAFAQILDTLKQISKGIDSFVESTKSTSGAAERLQEMADSLHKVIEEHSNHDENKKGAQRTAVCDVVDIDA